MCSVTTIAAVCNKEQNYAYCFLHFEGEPSASRNDED